MADEADETLGRLKQVDLLCDLYEEFLQSGNRLSPPEFLAREGVDPAFASSELLSELARLEASYLSKTAGVDRGDTQAFVPGVSKLVGRYELRRPLGSGGFGEVWVAFDPQLDREIAIKIPHKGVLGDSAAIGRFYREAKSAAKLKHANIVRIHDAGSDGSTHFIAAELIAGKTLKELCSARGMEIREAVRIVADLASAVFYAHRNQIVHRDIKPGNVLMDANNQPHLTDFGLASQQDASALTTNGTVLGTPIYMAPEQAAGRFGAALPTSDQYSLGTVLYELLTGRPPFSGTNSVVLYHKLNTAPPAPRTIRPEIPIEVEAICMKAMERIPEQRFPDCEAMAVALRSWLAGKAVTKSPFSQRGVWLATGVVIAVLAMMVLAVLYGPLRSAKQEGQSGDKPSANEPVNELANEFANVKPQLDLLFTEEDPDTAKNGFGKLGGHYTIIRNEPGYYARNVASVPEECVIEVRGRVRGGENGGWGVSLTSTDTTPAHGLAIEISARGWFLIERGPFEGDAEARGPQVGPITHSAVNRGEEYNTLRIALKKQSLTLFVNGVQVTEPVPLDRQFTPAVLALCANRGAGSTNVNPIIGEFQRVRTWNVAPALKEMPPKATAIAAQPPTPPNVEILDATPYLPLHPDRPRKVVDFIEIHGASFSQAAEWLKSLGPDYCPSVIGTHADAKPPQFHAIAYRVNRPVPIRVDVATSVGGDSENVAQYEKLHFHLLTYEFKVDSIGPDGCFLRTSTSDTDYWLNWVMPCADFDKQVADFKKRGFRPIVILPRYHTAAEETLVCSVGAHGKTNWEAVQFATFDELKELTQRARKEGRFLSYLRAGIGQEGELRFAVIALENSDDRDWDYQLDMSITEYEAELIRRKAEGFRPTTVTSYGDSKNPKYAAAWIRYFNLPKK